MCSCAPRPTSPDLATSPRSRCTSHTYQISPYLPLTSARCAPRPTRTTFCSGSPRPADESGGEMRLRAAGPHFCACVRSFRGCALRGARHEAPSLRLLCRKLHFRSVPCPKRKRVPRGDSSLESGGCHGSTPTYFTVQLAHNTHLQTPQNSRDTLSILYGVRRGGTHAARHYCTLAARRGRSSSLEVEGRELDAAAGGRSEGLLAQRMRRPRPPQAALTACSAESSSRLPKSRCSNPRPCRTRLG